MKLMLLASSLLLSCISAAEDEFSQFYSHDQVISQKWKKLKNGDSAEKIDKVFRSSYANSTGFWGEHKKAKNNFRRDCMKSFPHVGFCKCLVKEGAEKMAIPTVVGYVAILTDDKYSVDALGYDESIIKGFKKARNKCSKLLD